MRDRSHPADLLSALLDDELDEDSSLRVARHVGDCDQCAEELEDLRRTRTAIRQLPDVSPPPALLSGVPATAGDAAPRRLSATLALSAAAAGLLGAAFALGDQPRGDVVPPVDVVVVDHLARTGGGPMIQPINLDR